MFCGDWWFGTGLEWDVTRSEGWLVWFSRDDDWKRATVVSESKCGIARTWWCAGVECLMEGVV